MLWEIELGASPVDTPERRADLDHRLMENVALIADATVRNEYRRYVRDRLFEGRRKHRLVASSSTPGGFAQKVATEFVREGPLSPPRPPDRVQRELLFRILLQWPSLLDEVAEEFATIEMPEPDLDKLRREILQIEALHPGLEASTLRQHLHTNGFAATVEAFISPSVDSGFLIRRSATDDARNEWAHVIEMLMGGQRSVLAEASNHLIDDVSVASWEHFLAARERALQQNGGNDELI